jgi:SSS family solute:Na+ symporter
MKGVSDFMSGSRLANRYLLAVAGGEMQAGAVVFVAIFERIAEAGFTIQWWGWMTAPVGLVLTVIGFVSYRFRETRALTLAQFFEIRYSKRFRIFTGLLGFLAGIANFGIIPAVGARCMVYILGLPDRMALFGVTLPTYIPLMALFLGITVMITLAGGFITVMVTDCIEGILSQLIYLVLVIALLLMFAWPDIVQTLSATAPGHSKLNPFDSLALKDFNVWFVLMALANGVYGRMAWQNAAGYQSAALTAHEGRMGGILGTWREIGKMSVVTLLAVCAVTFLQHPHYAVDAAPAHEAIKQISDPQIQQQMSVPVALSQLLPVGIKGLLCAILVMGIFGGDSTHLHSWGGIFVQDVLLASRKKPFSPKQHVAMLRLGVIFVATFAFLFGCFFQQTEYIFMWWSVTTAIFVGGGGSAILGGLYWKKGTTAAAWAAMLTGSTLSVTGILLRSFAKASQNPFPFNGVQIAFGSMLIAITVYVIVSLLTSRKDFNLDRMLHRGEYAADIPDAERDAKIQGAKKRRFTWNSVLGISSDFSTGDKVIAGALFVWSIGWFLVFALGSLSNWVRPWPDSWWSTFWHIAGIGIPVFMTFVTGVWFTWGGLRDIRSLFRRLGGERTINPLDDGFVVGHQSLDEQAGTPVAAEIKKQMQSE